MPSWSFAPLGPTSGANMENLIVGLLAQPDLEFTAALTSWYGALDRRYSFTATGTRFVSDDGGPLQIAGGTITALFVREGTRTLLQASGFQLSVETLVTLKGAGATVNLALFLLAGRDKIFGTGLGDTLYGFSSADTMLGGGGNDALFGGNGHDSLYGGAGADSLLADADDDRVWGAGGNDILIGDAGNDWLYGGKGADLLIGDNGTDRFVFEAAPASGVDTIQAYQAEDAILLDEDAFLGIGARGALGAGALSPRHKCRRPQ
jgi:Ca2+-binding RTX toxin-like protein